MLGIVTLLLQFGLTYPLASEEWMEILLPWDGQKLSCANQEEAAAAILTRVSGLQARGVCLRSMVFSQHGDQGGGKQRVEITAEKIFINTDDEAKQLEQGMHMEMRRDLRNLDAGEMFRQPRV